MRVALISAFYEPERQGGVGTVVHSLANSLSERGIEVVVITTHGKSAISFEQRERLSIYRFLPLNLYWIGDKSVQPIWKRVLWQLVDVWNPHVFWVVKQILEKESPDIVHVHKLRSLSPAVWAAASLATPGNTVQTCHDYELMSPEGTLMGEVGSHAHEGSWPLRPYQLLRARLSQKVTTATAPSNYTLDLLSQKGFFSRALREVIPNSHGLTANQLYERREQVQEKLSGNGAVRLLFLGRLERAKGVQLLCAALKRSALRCPRLHLDVAGWGTLEPELRQRYGGLPNITFHGPVFGDEKWDLLRACDILVVPSIWPEVFGLVILEAYTYGKPVLATRTGGIPELVEQGKTGFLVPPADVDALTSVLCHVAQMNLAEIRSMAPACFEAARQYVLESVTGEYLSVYKTTLKR